MPKSSERTPWLQHELSTYSYLGRNDAAVNWLLQQRTKNGLSPCRNIVILGSGMIEPFTIAALPEAKDAQIIAVEIEGNLVDLGNRIKSGVTATWEEIAAISRHPGTQNTQLLNVERIRNGLQKLRTLNSLELLGSGVSETTFQIPQEIASRVTFINHDSLSALEEVSEANVICDFFVQTNINKSGESGIAYTRELVEQAFARLAKDGVYLIGDTGYNHQHTLNHIAQLAEARISAGSLVHIINKGDSFSSSWYLAVSRGDLFAAEDIAQVRERVEALADSNQLEIHEVRQTVGELADDINRVLYLAFISQDRELISWATASPLTQALLHLTSGAESEFGETIIFPGKNQP